MLTNIDLEEKAKQLVIPLVGIFSKNKLPPYRQPGGYIINLQDDSDADGNPLPGTHWTGFYVERKRAVYFDPFGVVAPMSVQHFLQGLDWDYSRKTIQNIQSTICGYYVIYFLWFMSHHKHIPLPKRFLLFQRLFSTDVEKNKTLLEKYIKPL